jgi:hypothetical protein
MDMTFLIKVKNRISTKQLLKIQEDNKNEIFF